MKKLLILFLLLTSIAAFSLTRPDWAQIANKPILDVWEYGAKGDGVTDDRAAIQACINAAYTIGGGVLFSSRHYKIGRVSSGAYDRYGLLIATSGMELIGVGSATLSRFDSINTGTGYSTSTGYPLVYIGVPNSVTSAIADVKISGLDFVGGGTLHSVEGSVEPDLRNAITITGVYRPQIKNCNFYNLDSQGIYCMPTGAAWVNKKVYSLLIENCYFEGASHATFQRARRAGVNLGRVDGAIIRDCSFLWCDFGITGDSTYVYNSDEEAEVYTATLGIGGGSYSVARGGQGVVITGNRIINSSEHSIYIGNRRASITGNTCYADIVSVCQGDIKVYGAQITVSGNTIRGNGPGVGIHEWARDISVIGNICVTASSAIGIGKPAGVIEIDAADQQAWINSRLPWWPDPSPQMENITISGNVLDLESAGVETGNAIRIFTDTSLCASMTGIATYGITGINVSDNVVRNCKTFLRVVGSIPGDTTIQGNKVTGQAGVTSGSVIMLEGDPGSGGYANAIQEFSVIGNTFENFAFYLNEISTSTAGIISPPFLTAGNKFRSLAAIKEASFKDFSSAYRFNNNWGFGVIDRNIPFGNSMANTTSNQFKFNNFEIVSTSTMEIRWYIDDVASYTRIATATP